MPRKQKFKYMTDVGMTMLLPLLMAYSLVGEVAHEWLGVMMLALFLLHLAQNFQWLKNIGKGTYSHFRLLQTGLILLIFLTMLGSMMSGILMSAHVFRFLHLHIQQTWTQSVHLFCAYWGFLFMSLHAGLHGAMILSLFRRRKKPFSPLFHPIILRSAASILAILGIAAFIRNKLFDYLFLQTHFVFFSPNQTLIHFLLDYVCMMVLFACVGYYTGKILQITSRSAKV